MKSFLFLISATLAIFAACSVAVVAQAQSSKTPDCRYYREIIAADDILPEKTLVNDWQLAIPCLVEILASLKDDVKSGKKIDQFVRTTGAIRIIIASKEGSEKPNPAITLFRKNATLDVASTLAYGARSDAGNARLNAVLVFGNVIDNQFVCVPIDHLYDPKIMNAEPSPTNVSQVRARVNLLAVVAVVAPWAYKENFENLERVYEATAEAFEATKGDWEMESTADVLRRLKERLEYQKRIPNPPMNTYLPAGLDACKYYKPLWARGRLSYQANH